MSHTPGPWEWRERSDDMDRGGIFGPNDAEVCWFGDGEQYYPTDGNPPNEADRALILAAPDLLVMLKYAVEAEHDRINPPKQPKPPSGFRWLQFAEQAIAKAEGK